jgi:hypothetical protein
MPAGACPLRRRGAGMTGNIVGMMGNIVGTMWECRGTTGHFAGMKWEGC